MIYLPSLFCLFFFSLSFIDTPTFPLQPRFRTFYRYFSGDFLMCMLKTTLFLGQMACSGLGSSTIFWPCIHHSKQWNASSLWSPPANLTANHLVWPAVFQVTAVERRLCGSGTAICKLGFCCSVHATYIACLSVPREGSLLCGSPSGFFHLFPPC